MSEIVVRTPLKQGPGRSVHLETGPDGDVVRVVKRFHGRTPWSAWRDRTRSRREFAALCALAARGVPVPEPLERRRLGGVWEVSMAWLPDTVTLQSLLPSRELWPVAPERLAAPLGRLLAGLHSAGLDHGDLHAGNVLISPAGLVWAIDFHSARVRKRLRAEVLLRDLTRLAAGVREFLPPRFRARFLLGWWHALPDPLRESVGPPGRLVARIERAARERRHDVVRGRRARWTRSGSAVRAVSGPARPSSHHGLAPLLRHLPFADRDRVTGFERVDLDPGWACHLAGAVGPGGMPQRLELAFPGAGTRRLLLLRGGSYRRLRESWYAAARLVEHRIPVMGPLALVRTPVPCAAFEVQRDAAFLSQVSERDLPPRAKIARALGHLCGSLHDRHLTPSALAGDHVLVTPRGELCLAGIPGLDPLDPFDGRARRRDMLRWRALVGGREPSFGAAFAQGYLAAWRGTAAERALLGAELAHG